MLASVTLDGAPENFALGIADENLPDAYEEGGPLIALATAARVVVTFPLK